MSRGCNLGENSRLYGVEDACRWWVLAWPWIRCALNAGPSTPGPAPARETRYVDVSVDGETVQARFHNLTGNRLSALVSVDGKMLVVPLQDIQFHEASSEESP